MKNISVKKYWIKWQTEKLQEDLKYCHPRWPQEEQAIRHEIKRISKLKGVNEADAWFYYDWIVLIVMITALVMHIVYYKVATDDLRYAYTRVLSVANLVVSLRLLKIMRPFPGIGTLVLILGETSGDFMNWAFLFFLLLVPFTASFWIIFGGLSLQPVNDYDEPDGLIFSVFRMAVGDDFNLEALIAAEPVMARILTVLYVTAMTIVTLNLLIALLSDTFTRVHSNAIANTIMQRAIKVLEAERTLSKQKKLNYREYIRINCSPEAVESVLDAGNYNGANNSKEITDNFKNLKTLLDDRFAAVYGKNKLSDFDKLKQDISKIKEIQRNQNDDLIRITEMLRKFKGNGTAKETSGDSTSSSTNEPSKKRIQIPALSLFRESIHWFSANEGTREKKRKRNDQTKKRDDRRKDRKDRAQNDGQEMSLVPYQRVNSRDLEENGTYFSKDEYSQDNPTDRLDEWDKLSVDSITL